MKVVLAGYNIDSDVIKTLKERADWNEDNLTPETLSAAYARISRDPAEIGELRKRARIEIEKARKSNESIIFGLGHSSVAEHAVFNFDICGVSRLAAETVQSFRLASFTEKSQRYITLGADFVVPPELRGSRLEQELIKLIKLQNGGYFSLFETLKEISFNKFPAKITAKRDKTTVEGRAKEDARYLVSLAAATQFGMTVNARTLENMLRKFASSDLEEVRDLGKKIYETVQNLTPSIIKYTVPTQYEIDKKFALKNILKEKKILISSENCDQIPVKLQYFTKDSDDFLCASLIYNYSTRDFESSMRAAKRLSYDEKSDLIKASLSSKKSFEKVERAFETVEFVFELIVSATNYAQLKRHRMTTQIVQDYDLELGYAVPPSVRESGQTALFSEIIKKSEQLYALFEKESPSIKNYALTNAHRRRVLLKLNARELYHFIALRDDDHAQWDIRETAKEIARLAKSVAPLTTMLLSGKSDYENNKRGII